MDTAKPKHSSNKHYEKQADRVGSLEEKLSQNQNGLCQENEVISLQGDHIKMARYAPNPTITVQDDKCFSNDPYHSAILITAHTFKMENIQICKKTFDMRFKTHPKSNRLIDLIYFRGIHKLLQKPDWS